MRGVRVVSVGFSEHTAMLDADALVRVFVDHTLVLEANGLRRLTVVDGDVREQKIAADDRTYNALIRTFSEDR